MLSDIFAGPTPTKKYDDIMVSDQPPEDKLDQHNSEDGKKTLTNVLTTDTDPII